MKIVMSGAILLVLFKNLMGFIFFVIAQLNLNLSFKLSI